MICGERPMNSNVKVFEEDVIAVFGSNDAADGDEAFQRAHEVGKTLARLGYQVANGGLRGGGGGAGGGGRTGGGGGDVGEACGWGWASGSVDRPRG